MTEGLALSSLGIALYFGILFVWSVLVTYLVVFGVFGSNAPVKGSHDAGHAPVRLPAAHAPAPKAPEPAKPFRGYSEYEGFKSFATGDSITVEDIVQGLARESGAAAIHEQHAAERTHEPVHEELPAPEMHEALPLPTDDPAHAAAVAQAAEFLRVLVAGDCDAAFDTLREIEETGEGAEPFLRRVLGAVELALESRMNGAACDLRVLDVLGSCDTPAMERLVAALSTSEGKHGGKLALTRAFNALK